MRGVEHAFRRGRYICDGAGRRRDGGWKDLRRSVREASATAGP